MILTDFGIFWTMTVPLTFDGAGGLLGPAVVRGLELDEQDQSVQFDHWTTYLVGRPSDGLSRGANRVVQNE